jgi:hypothetical protein
MAKGTLHLNVEFSAVADEEGKFARLARLLGLADADHARGKCEHLWVACTRRGESELPQWLVEQVLGELGPEALVDAELAGWAGGRGDSKTRRLRIGGAGKHCLWMVTDQVAKRDQSSKGGKTRAATASRAGGRFTRTPGDDPPAQTSPSEITTASASDPEDQNPPPAGARAIPPAPEPGPAPPRAPESTDLASRQTLRSAIWSELAAARESVAAELKLPEGDRKLMAFDPGERALGVRLRDARNDAELELVAQQARKAIAVIAAEARASRSVEWLTGSVFESDRSWRRAVGKSLADAKRPPPSRDRYAKPEPFSMPRAEFPPDLPPVTDTLEERLALAAAARARLGEMLAEGATDETEDEYP